MVPQDGEAAAYGFVYEYVCIAAVPACCDMRMGKSAAYERLWAIMFVTCELMCFCVLFCEYLGSWKEAVARAVF